MAGEKPPSTWRKPPTNRLLLADYKQESIAVYTDGFRAYEPLDEDDASDRQYVVHGEGEYADCDVHTNTCESHRGVAKDKLTPYVRALQFRKRVRRKLGDEALRTILEPCYDATNNRLHKSEPKI